MTVENGAAAPQEIEVARVDQIPPGWALTVKAGARPLVIANCNGDLSAFDNACTHAAGPLGDSRLKQDCRLTCPWHDSAFDARTGEVLTGPARKPLKTYELTVREGSIFVNAE